MGSCCAAHASPMSAPTGPDYLLIRGASVPDGYEPLDSWEEGIEAAKRLGFSGDAVAHGSYGAFNPNTFGHRRPKGMFRSTGNGRFHFNCGAGGGAEGDDHILVRRMGGVRKPKERLRLEDIPVPLTIKSVNNFSPPTDVAALQQKWCGVDSLREAIRSGDTIMLKGTWISRFSKQGGILPRRQDLPDDAKWPAEELCARLNQGQLIHDWAGRVPLVALSYCWENSKHPDPRGEQMARVAKVIDVCTQGLGRDKAVSAHVCDEIAMFWDYASLYQGQDRSQEEVNSFKRGLFNVNLWYGHQLTTVWMLTRVPDGVKPYTERGWPCFERCLSEQITPFHFALDLGRCPDDYQGQYWNLKNICNSGREPPVQPLEFDEILKQKTFTNGSDAGVVMNLYKQSFEGIMSSATRLVYEYLNWGADQYMALAKVLPACFSLETLVLNCNSPGNPGAEAIAAVLQCAPITRLEVRDNKFDAKGVGMLMVAANQLQRKCVLCVSSNKVESADRDVLKELFPNCHVEW